MDVARCILDDEIYQAVLFAGLAPSAPARKKGALVCCECGGPAYYRRASRSGQAACFCARPHKEDCGLAARNSEQTDKGLGDDQDRLVNPGNRIILDLNSGKAEPYRHNDPNEAANLGGRGGRFNGNGSRPNAAMHRNLKAILHKLITSEEFRNSRVIIEIPGIGEFMASKLFVHFDTLAQTISESFETLDTPAEAFVGKYRGFWGKINNAGLGQGTIWLNSTVKIRVPESLKDKMYQELEISDLNALAGAEVLAIGTLKKSHMHERFYVLIEDLGCIAMKLADM